MSEFPLIISVDDHVVEPPTLWTDRLPSRYGDRIPHIAMIDEWCAGDAAGRLIPLTIVPFWDVQLAAQEVRRCADKGSYAIVFTENPHPVGLPSYHDAGHYWDPLFAACEETGTIDDDEIYKLLRGNAIRAFGLQRFGIEA